MTKLHFLILFLAFPDFSENLINDAVSYHSPKPYSNDDIIDVVSKYNDTYLREALDNILVPRVVGSPAHGRVRHFIVDSLESLGYTVELDTFTESTPTHGQLEFSNIIAKLNPNAERYLTLACHYDSKYFPEHNPQKFVAATDSAVPCSMMLEIAFALREEFRRAQNKDPSLMFIFFDGEEAFKDWNAQDSLYGSRNLAARWSSTPFVRRGITTNALDKMDMLVLLDLIGAANPTFYSFFQSTARWHSYLARTEQKLKSLGLLPARAPQYFLEKSTYGGIEDDHIPFLKREVPILHVISYPFPQVWHTLKDDYSALDFPTIRSITVILHTFVATYLHL